MRRLCKSIPVSRQVLCFVFWFCMSGVIPGCSTLDIARQRHQDQTITKKPHQSEDPVRFFLSQLPIQRAPSIQHDLMEIVQRLNTQLAFHAIKADTQDHRMDQGRKIDLHLLLPIEKKWVSFPFLNDQIYLSWNLIQAFKFEHEVAGFIALQLAHLILHHPEKRAELLFEQSVHQPGPSEVLTDPGMGFKKLRFQDWVEYSPAEEKEAIFIAAQTLYHAGYDPRGVVAVYQMYLSHFSVSPYSQAYLLAGVYAAERAVAENPPLRNPWANSEKFTSIKKRMEAF